MNEHTALAQEPRLPLAGLRILDMSRLLPGPFGTQVLADFGADVIRVEDLRGSDGFRTAQPLRDGVSFRHMTLNRNKRSVALDLKSPAGLEAFRRLAAGADALLEQFRPGVMARLGLDYEALSAINPRLVYCSLSGFGQDGPLRDVVAHDPNYLALSGIMSLLGRRGSPPMPSGVQISDIVAGLSAALAIMMALHERQATGRGRYIDVSLYDSAISTLVTAAAGYFGTGTAPSRGEDRHNGRYPMSDVYECSDGGHIAISAIEPHFWANLCKVFGHPEWLPHQYDDGETGHAIRAELTRIFLTRTRDEWFEALRDAEICISPVLSVAEALDAPHTRARGLVIDHVHPRAGRARLLGNAIRMGAPTTVRRPAPELGEHTGEVLAEAGLSSPEIESLITAGAASRSGR